jgi:hypothetical protein
MIVYEPYGEGLVRAYSDKGMFIHGGNPEMDYVDAVDPVDANRTYTETDIPIEPDEEISDSEALAIITGADEGAEGGEEA